MGILASKFESKKVDRGRLLKARSKDDDEPYNQALQAARTTSAPRVASNGPRRCGTLPQNAQHLSRRVQTLATYGIARGIRSLGIDTRRGCVQLRGRRSTDQGYHRFLIFLLAA